MTNGKQSSVGSPQSSVGGQSALNNDVSISASSLIILRYLPDGRMVPIEVDLYLARTDVAEQVIIQPGDYLLLQYRKPKLYKDLSRNHAVIETWEAADTVKDPELDDIAVRGIVQRFRGSSRGEIAPYIFLSEVATARKVSHSPAAPPLPK